MLPIRRSYRPYYMSNFFENDFDSFNKNRQNTTPAVNVREDEKSYSIEMALPGIKKDEIKIEIEKDLLIISSEANNSTEESKDGYSRREFSYNSFCRNFTIPENADSEKINAAYKDGILNILIPKSKDEVKASRVVKVS